MAHKPMAVILLSGGLDSAFNLAAAARDGRAKLAITMRYGQRAENQEIQASKRLAAHYGVRWEEVDVSWLGRISGSGLTRSNLSLPNPTMADLDNLAASEASKKAVWVCNRNGVFLNIAAAFAEAIGVETVLAGFNREEAATFPDNSVAYMKALDQSFHFSTQKGVTVDSYSKDLSKSEIVMQSLGLNLPFPMVWSCYESGEKRCWRCESCKRTERALLAAGAAGVAVLKELGGQQ